MIIKCCIPTVIPSVLKQYLEYLHFKCIAKIRQKLLANSKSVSNYRLNNKIER